MSNLFYRNRRLLILVISLIIVAGGSSYVVLPRMEDPMLTPRFALVNTVFPGADAERVESLVTEKIEDELREIEEIKEVRSFSRTGVSTLSIELRDDVYVVDDIWSRIRDKLDDAALEMPPGVRKPDFDQQNVRAYALIVALTWERADPTNYSILRRLTEQLEDQIKQVSGTEEIDTFGDPEEEIVAMLHPERMLALGLTTQQVSQSITDSDAKVAAGMMRGRDNDLLLEIDSELDSLERVRRTPVMQGNDGQTVQLGDIADVRKDVTSPSSRLALVFGKPAVAIGVLVRARQRIDEWDARTHDVLREFSERLPDGVKLNTVFRQNSYVTQRLSSLTNNLLLGGLAVVIVVWFMMGWRNALIVGASLPLSAMTVLAGLRFLEIPIHQMSVTGLILALGLLIDNAIVVVDEVTERMSAGDPPGLAVSHATRHLAVPLFGSTLTTAMAFAPIVLMEGPAGEFVGAIAVSVMLAIGSSFVLAMTVIPAITAMSNPGIKNLAGHWWQTGWRAEWMTRAYSRTLELVLARPILGVLIGVALPVFGFIQARHLTEQFFPPADRDQFQIELELPAHASIAQTLETAKQVRTLLMAHDQVTEVHWFLGESAPSFYYNVVPRRKNTSNYAQAMVQLNSTKGATQLIHELQAELDVRLPSARALVRQLEQGPPFDAPIELRLFGPDIVRLRELGEHVRRTLVKTPNVLHTRAELLQTLPKLALVVDETESRLAGLTHESIARQLNAALEGAVGGSVLEATEELPVRIRLHNSDRAELHQIESIDLLPISTANRSASRRDADGISGIGYDAVPLSAIGHTKLVDHTATIPRLNGIRMNEIQAFLPAGVLPAVVLNDFQQRWDALGIEMPNGYSLSIGGEAAKRDDAVGNLLANVGVLAVMMVATLVLSFSSFRIAGLVGAVAMLSAGLGVGALWLFGYPFGFMAIVGTMGLVGVAINDAIVVVAAIMADEKAKTGDPDAVREVVLRSTRHVIATSLTTMAGFAPLVIAGGGFWPPLAIAIAGGVGGATILALYFVPAVLVALSPKPAAG